MPKNNPADTIESKKRKLINQDRIDSHSSSSNECDAEIEQESSSDLLGVFETLDNIIDRIEKPESFELLALTPESKAQDLKFIGHVFGDAFISNLMCNGVSLEGHYSLEILEHILNYLSKTVAKLNNPALDVLTLSLQKAYQRSKKWDDELKQKKYHSGRKKANIYDQFAVFGNELVQELQALRPDEHIILVSGWRTHTGGGHALYKKVTKLPLNEYRVTIYNSGAGLTHHLKHVEWEQNFGHNHTVEKFTASISASNIPAASLEDDVLWTAFVEYNHGHLVTETNASSANVESIYKRFLKTISPQFGASANDNLGIKRRMQISGTCTVKGLFALIASELPPKIYKVDFKLDLRLALLKQIDQYLEKNFSGISIDDFKNTIQKIDKEITSSKNDFYGALKKVSTTGFKFKEFSSLEAMESYWRRILDNPSSLKNIQDYHFIHQKFNLLRKKTQQKKFLTELENNRSEMRLFELSVQKTVRSIFKLTDKGLLSEAIADKHLQFLQQLHDRITSVHNATFEATQIKLPITLKPEKSGWSFSIPPSANITKVIDKTTAQVYKNQFLDRINAALNNDNLVLMLEEARELIHEHTKHNSYFIKLFFKKIPSVDLNEVLTWRGLNLEDNQKCMNILHELSTLWYLSDTDNFIFRDKTTIVYTEKIFAIIHQLYSQFNKLPAEVMIRPSHVNFGGSYRAKSPYLALHDIASDKEMKKTMEYFQSLSSSSSSLPESKAKLFAIEIVHCDSNSYFTANEDAVDTHEGEFYFIKELLQNDPSLEKKIRNKLKEVLSLKLEVIKKKDDYKDKQGIQALSIEAAEIPINWVIMYLMSTEGMSHLALPFQILKSHSYLTQSMLYSESAKTRHLDVSSYLYPNYFDYLQKCPSSSLTLQWKFIIGFKPDLIIDESIEKIRFGKARLHYEGPTKSRKMLRRCYELDQLEESQDLLTEHKLLITGSHIKFKYSYTQHHIINKKQETSLSLAEERAISLIWSWEHRAIRVAKIIEYFLQNKAKLDNKKHQMHFYVALFESQVLLLNFNEQPLLAAHLYEFLTSTYTYFEEKMSISGMAFCLRILGMLEPYFNDLQEQFERNLNSITKLHQFIQSDKFSDAEKTHLHYERLFLLSYTSQIQKEHLQSYLESVIHLSRHKKSNNITAQYMDVGINELNIRIFQSIYHFTQHDLEFSSWLNNVMMDIFHHVYPEFSVTSPWKIGDFMKLNTEKNECAFDLENQTALFQGGGITEFPKHYMDMYKHVKVPASIVYYPLESDCRYSSLLTYEFFDEHLNKNYIHETNSECSFSIRDKNAIFEKEIAGLKLRHSSFRLGGQSLDIYGFSTRYSQWNDIEKKNVYFLFIDQSKIVMKSVGNQLQYVEQGDKEGLFLVKKKNQANSYDFVARFDADYCVWKNEHHYPLYIELPNYNLQFRIQYQPNFSIISVEYPDFTLAQCQSIKNLAGFNSYLVLENKENNRTLVFIPESKISPVFCDEHVYLDEMYNEIAGQFEVAPADKTTLFYTYEMNDAGELEANSNEENLYLVYIYLSLRKYEYTRKPLLRLLKQTKSLSEIEEKYLMCIIFAEFIEEAQGIATRLLAALILYNQFQINQEQSKIKQLLFSLNLNLDTFKQQMTSLLSSYFLNRHSLASLALSKNQEQLLLKMFFSNKNSDVGFSKTNIALWMNLLNNEGCKTIQRTQPVPSLLDCSFLNDEYRVKNDNPKLGQKTILDKDFLSSHLPYLYRLARMVPKNPNNPDAREKTFLAEQKKLRTLLKLNKINTEGRELIRFLQLVLDYPHKFPEYNVFIQNIKITGASSKKNAASKNIRLGEALDTEAFIREHIKPVILNLIPQEQTFIPYFGNFNLKTSPPILEADKIMMNTDSGIKHQDLNRLRDECIQNINKILSPFYKIETVDTVRINKELQSKITERLRLTGVGQDKTLRNRLNTAAKEVDAYCDATKQKRQLYFVKDLVDLQKELGGLIQTIQEKQHKKITYILELYSKYPTRYKSFLKQKYHAISEQMIPKNIHDLVQAYYSYEINSNELQDISPGLYCDLPNHSKAQELKLQIEGYLIDACELNRLKRIFKIIPHVIKNSQGNSEEEKSLLDKYQQDLITELEFQRWYDLNQRKEFLIFEYYSNLFIREAQILSIERLLQNQATQQSARKGIVLQMQPGDGKTQVILPLLALLFADGAYLSMQIIPEELMLATADQLSTQAFRIYKRFFGQLNWSNTSLSGLKILDSALEQMTISRSPILVTDKELHLFFLQERMLELSYNETLTNRQQNSNTEQSLLLFRKIRNRIKYKTKAITEECDLIWDLRHQVHVSYSDSLPVSQDFHDLAALIYEYLATDLDINNQVNFSFSKSSNNNIPTYTDELFEQIKPILIQKLVYHLFKKVLKPGEDVPSIIEAIRAETKSNNQTELFIINYFSQQNNNKNEVLACFSVHSDRVQKAFQFIKDELDVYLKATIPQKFERHYGFFSDEGYFIEYFISQFAICKGAEKDLIPLFLDTLKEREMDFEAVMQSTQWPKGLKEAIVAFHKQPNNVRSTSFSTQQKNGFRNLFNAMDLAGPFKGAKKPKFGSELGNETEVINLTIQGRLERGISVPLFKKELRRLQDQALYEKNNAHNLTLHKTQAHQKFVAMCGEELASTMWLSLTEKEISQIVQQINSSPLKIINFLRKFVLTSLYMPAKRLTSNDKILVDLFTNEQGTFVDGMTGTPDKSDTYHTNLVLHPAPYVAGKIISILCEKSWNDVYSFEDESSSALLDRIFSHSTLKHVNALIDMGALFKDRSNLEIAQIILKKTDPKKIEAIRFFQDNQLMILLRNTSEIKPYVKNLVPSELCFSIYDQLHCTGIDLEHGVLATAIVTQDIRDTFRDLKQSPYRMRGLDKKQKVHLLISNKMKNILLQTIKDRPIDILDCIIYSIKIQCQQEVIDNPTAVIHNLTNETYKAIRSFLDSIPVNFYSYPAIKQLINYFVITLQDNNAPEKMNFLAKVPVKDALNEYNNKIIGAFNSFINTIAADLSYISSSRLLFAYGNHIINAILAKDVLEDFITCHSANEVGISVEQQIMVQQQAQQEVQLDIENANSKCDPSKAFIPSEKLFTKPSYGDVHFACLVNKHLYHLPKCSGYEWLRSIMPSSLFCTEAFYYHGTNAQPFDLTQKDVSCLLVLAPKIGNDARFIMLSSELIPCLLNVLSQVNSNQPLFNKYYIGLYMLNVGLIKKGPEEIPSEFWTFYSTKVVFTVLKFMNGELNYTFEEKKVLNNLFTNLDFHALNNLEDNFIKNKLKFKESKELYPKSILKNVFEQVKVTKTRPQAVSSLFSPLLNRTSSDDMNHISSNNSNSFGWSNRSFNRSPQPLLSPNLNASLFYNVEEEPRIEDIDMFLVSDDEECKHPSNQ